MSTSTLVLVIPFFKEIGDLKRLLTGNDTHTLIAARKGRSVASVVVKNNQLCATSETTSSSGGQRCGSRGCLTCPTVVQENEGLCVNGRILSPGIQLNCKSSNVIRYRITEISTDMLAKQCNLSIKQLMATGHVLMSMGIFKSGKNQHCPSMPMSLTKITSTSEILK